VQNLSLRRVFANVLGPAAPLAACAKWRLSVAKCRFGIAGWHFLAAKVPLGAGGGHVVCKIVASGQ
ncbi:MAG: hypothetical protein SO138_03315, partial [Prevotella sp.]|nr:hypothetical protein [Prevotella sp.]